MPSENVLTSEIRSIKLVIDIDDLYNPEMTLETFIEEKGKEPEPPNHKIVTIEILTCPHDGQPVSVSECGKCRKFIRRLDNKVYCRNLPLKKR